MEFRLIYRGPLKANGSPKEKQRLRREFHPQLKRLWNQVPLRDVHEVLKPQLSETMVGLMELRDPFKFIPLISMNKGWETTAQLNILFLRPEPPGAIVSHGGDLDNRIKTLLDGLRMPDVPSEIPDGDTPAEDEDPFFCLLQDDALVVGLSVETDRLLDSRDSSEVMLVIHVEVKIVRASFKNMALV